MTRRAFTLIELLVVVAIIASLIAILLPSMGRSRQTAKSVVCASNERSVGLAMEMYLNDNHHQRFPRMWLPLATPPVEPIQVILYPYVGRQKDVFLDPAVLGNPVLWVRPDGVEVWPSYAYHRGLDVPGVTPNSLRSPDRAFVWSCTMNTTERIPDDFLLWGPWWPGFARSIIADWHLDAFGNMLFADGHVQSVVSAQQDDPSNPMYAGWLYPTP